MAGIKCKGTPKGAVLLIPTKDGQIQEFWTSKQALRNFVDGKFNVVYFNPRSDFVRKGKWLKIKHQ